MTRRIPIRRGLGALAAGLAMAIFIAWAAMFLPTGNAWWGPRTSEELGLSMADDGKLWVLTRGANRWHSVVSYWHMQVSGRAVMIPREDYEARKFDYGSLPAHFRPDSLDDLHMNAWYHETGWPLGALSCSVHWQRQVSNADILYAVRGGVQLPRDSQFNPRALPLMPRPGLAVNALVFAVGWFVLMSGATAAHARWRRRRGRCAACGYSRAGLAPDARCPECGSA